MRKKILISGLSAIAIAVAIGITSPANAQQYYGDSWNDRAMMGRGMMGGYGQGMVGPGMMGSGMMGGYGQGMTGPGMMGPGMMGGYGQGMTGPGMMGPGMMGGYGQGMMGPGMMGPGMMGGCGQGMMGPGMMGGYGQGMLGGWGPQQQANLNLSAADVKTYLERWIALSGNPRIKVGNVMEKDADTITADIVTTEKDALVQQFNVDRRNGFWQPVQ